MVGHGVFEHLDDLAAGEGISMRTLLGQDGVGGVVVTSLGQGVRMPPPFWAGDVGQFAGLAIGRHGLGDASLPRARVLAASQPARPALRLVASPGTRTRQSGASAVPMSWRFMSSGGRRSVPARPGRPGRGDQPDVARGVDALPGLPRVASSTGTKSP